MEAVTTAVKRFLFKTVAIFGLGTSLSFGAATTTDSATNVVRNFLETKVARLSLVQQSASSEFGFEVRNFDGRGRLAAITEVIADHTRAGILMKASNGLPFCIMVNRLCVGFDADHPGELVYYQGGTPLWGLLPSRGGSNSLYKISYLREDESPEIDLNLGAMLMTGLSSQTTTNLSYDKETRIVSISSRAGTKLAVQLTSETTTNTFGAESFSFSWPGSTLLITNISLSAKHPLALLRVSKRDIDSLGVPMREIAYERISLSAPREFPRTPQEKRAAEKLLSLLSD